MLVEERYACDRSFFITVECSFSGPDELPKQLADEKAIGDRSKRVMKHDYEIHEAVLIIHLMP